MAKRLESIFNSYWLTHHMNPIVPMQSFVVKPQMDFGYGAEVSSRTLGAVYELMTASFYGGKTRNYIRIDEAREDGKRAIQPDVMDIERKRMFEVKAVVLGSDCKLKDDQIERYKYLQSRNKDYNVYFAFYKHGFKGIGSYKGSQEDLFKAVAENSKLSVVLPLSLVIGLHNHRGNGIYRYDGEKSHVSTHVLAGTFNDILYNPNEVIQRIGLDPFDYAFKRQMSPMDFLVNGSKLRQFPILFVEDRNHEDWIERFSRTDIQVDLFEHGDDDFSLDDGRDVVPF